MAEVPEPSRDDPAASTVESNNEKPRDVSSESMDVAKTIEISSEPENSKLPFKCDECDKAFKSKDGLRRHLGVFHGKGKYHECAECHKRCATPRELVRHQEGVHLKLKPFGCDICGRHFSESCTVKYHKKTVHDQHKKKRERKQICDKCGKTFFQKNHLDDHIASVHGTDRLHPCAFCGKNFKTRRDARSHQNLVHKRSKSHKCIHCDKLFKTPYEARRHAYQVHERERKRKCTVCKRVFTCDTPLKKHLAIMHGIGRFYKCADCETRFLTDKAYKHHRLTAHEKQKPFPCPVCGKRFLFTQDVKAHREEVHEKIKQLECTQCDKRFCLESGLVKHVKQVHSEVPQASEEDAQKSSKEKTTKTIQRRPFKCCICFARFISRTQLVLHRIDTHKSRKKSAIDNERYHCTKCGERFTRSYDVKEHMKTDHAGMRLIVLKPRKKTGYPSKQPASSLAQKITFINDDKPRYQLRRSTRIRMNSRGSLVQTVHTRLVSLRTRGQRKQRLETIASRLAEKAVS